MNFDKFPIVIVGVAPRCGSTPYVELLEQKLKTRAFREPWHSKIYSLDKSYLLHYEEYIQYKKTTNKYIVKFMIHDLELRSPYLNEIENGYKILLMRKDIVSQLASWYIANHLDKFHTLKHELEKKYTVEIIPKDISILITRLSRSLFYANHLQIFDQRIYYEDIDFSELKTNYKKTQQPENYEEIKQEIESQMKDTIPKHWRA